MDNWLGDSLPPQLSGASAASILVRAIVPYQTPLKMEFLFLPDGLFLLEVLALTDSLKQNLGSP